MARLLQACVLSVLVEAESIFLGVTAKAETPVSGNWSAPQSTSATENSDAGNSGNDFNRPLSSIELRLRYQPLFVPDTGTEKE